MALGGLVVYLTANTAQFTAAMQGAASVSQSTSTSIARSLGVVQLSLAAIAVKAAMIFVDMGRDAIQFGNDITKAADKAGVGTVEMAKLAYAARAADVDLSSLSVAVKSFQIAMSKASSGAAEQKDALDALGLTYSDLKGLSLEDQFKVIAEQINKLQEPTDKTRAATTLFGKAGADLLPMFTEGAKGITKAFVEYQKLNGQMTAEKIAALKESSDKVKTLGEAWDAFANKLMAKVAPALTWVLEKATAPLIPTDPERMIKVLEYQLAGMERANDKSEKSEYARIKRQLDAYRAMVAERTRIETSAKPLPTTGAAKGYPTEEEIKRQQELERLRKEAEAELKRLAGERQSILDNSLKTYMGMVLSAEELAVWELSRLNPSKEQLAILVAQTDATKNLRLQNEAAKKAEEETKRLDAEKIATVKEFKDAVYETATPLEKYATDLERIYSATQRYIAAGVDATDVMALQQREIDSLQKSFSPLERVAIEFGERMSSAFEEAILAGKGFSEILKSLLQDILKIIVRLTITEPLGNAIAGWVRGGGLGNIFNFMTPKGYGGGLENILATVGVSGLATGGFVRANQPYLVGEKGPELFTPSSYGEIIPNNQLGAAAPAVMSTARPIVRQTFNITTPNPDAFRLSQRQIVRRARLAVSM
jgi:hypothetical protein